MSASGDVTRFFDTSGCLNLSRPNSGSRKTTVKPQTRPRIPSSIPIRGQPKIDLYNFDHIDFADSKYVLTSPRSLQACARLNIKVSLIENSNRLTNHFSSRLNYYRKNYRILPQIRYDSQH